jgi:8-hydroxy-5-deazaflavin:NADPH oxidoreductase
MRVGIVGSGMVGTTVGTRLMQLGHKVLLGTRDAASPTATEWAATSGGTVGTYPEAVKHGELIINATAGTSSVAALRQADPDDLVHKVVIDIANPLDFSNGFPPSLNPVNTDSLGEQLQAAFPQARIVKTLNTVLASIMIDPRSLPGRHDIFLAGNDEEAKDTARELLIEFGWPVEDIIDLGGIRAARGTEMFMALWLGLDAALGTGNFNIRVVRP